MRRWIAVFLLAMSAAAAASERAIVKEVVVKATADSVWKKWTTADGIRSFFAPDALVDPRPDGPFQIYMNPYAPPGLKGADDMRYLALQEGKFVSFTWNAPPNLPQARRQRTVVIVRFAPAGEGETKVTLTHTGWGEGGEWDETYKYFDRAWGRVLANLEKSFDEGPFDWAPWLERMKASVPAGK